MACSATQKCLKTTGKYKIYFSPQLARFRSIAEVVWSLQGEIKEEVLLDTKEDEGDIVGEGKD